jgi:hypothetical protein
MERKIEAVLGIEIFLDLRRNILFPAKGPAGRKTNHEKGERRDDEEDWNHLQQAARNEAEHWERDSLNRYIVRSVFRFTY